MSRKQATTAARRALYVQFNNPAALPPLEHSTRILADLGWQVLVLGAGQQSADALRFPPHPNIEVRMLPYCPPGWRQKLHFLRFCLWVFSFALRWRPQWVYASDMMAAPVALALSFVARWKVIYHEHDSPRMGGAGKPSGFIRLVLSARRRLARRAAICIVPNAGRAAALRESTATQRPLLTVWNCPKRSEAEAIKARKPAEGEFVLFYHGSIVPARMPFTVLQAMQLIPVLRLRVAGYETIGHPQYVTALQRESERLGVGGRFEYLGPIPQRADLLAACREADVGLALMPEAPQDINEQTMAGASNKPFDYLACGLALLVSDLPDWNQLFVEPGYALACRPSDVGSIATALRKFIADPVGRAELGNRGRQKILAEWNYQTQFQPVLSQMTTR